MEAMDYVICGPETNLQTTSCYAAHSFAASGVDHSWDFSKFKEQFKLRITDLTADVLKFDLVGVHPSVANALRRIMIAEVPTMAIEYVFVIDNTGVMQDEVLAHRLGLVPIKADARSFEWKTEDAPSNERNCIVFKLDVKCTSLKGNATHNPVLSRDLKWLPEGSEMPDETECRFTSSQVHPLVPIRPVHEDILLTKLQSKQAITLEAHCFKGSGKDHAKWSPVSTAWYRLRPEVVLLKEVVGQKAKFLTEKFEGLFALEKKEGSHTEVAKVLETRGNERYLEQIRRLSGDPDWEKKLQLRKQKNYFLFTVESTGQYTPEDVFLEAVDVLIGKCDRLIKSVSSLR